MVRLSPGWPPKQDSDHRGSRNRGEGKEGTRTVKYYELTDALARLREARAAPATSAMLRALDARLRELEGFARAAEPLLRSGDGLDRRLRSALAAEIRDVRKLYVAELAAVKGGRIR